MIHSMLTRLRAYAHTDFQDPKSRILLHKNSRFQLAKDARIVIEKGTLQIGFPLTPDTAYASRPLTAILMANGARLICRGNVKIGPGVSVRICEGATLILEGDNNIAHDCFFFCNRKIQIGRNTHFSWNVTLMDHDGHLFYNESGAPLRLLKRDLIIGDNVGFQMNVVVPAGVKVGNNSLICANSVIRNDVPAFSTVYSDPALRVHEGVHLGLERGHLSDV